MERAHMKSFNPAEILQVALDVETNGEKLYAGLSEAATDQNIKAVWDFLREQEVAHRRIFEQMLQQLGEYFVKEFAPDEYELYMQAIASDFILTPKLIAEKLRQPPSSDLAAVEFGITVEKESILAYSLLNDLILQEKQHVLQAIIKEEKKHLVKLCLLKDYLKQGGAA